MQSTEVIKSNAKNELKVLTENGLEISFEQFQMRWRKCVGDEGNCLKGDKIIVRYVSLIFVDK